VVAAGSQVIAGVVRVGDTVRRAAGPWTPAVHALLRHLRDAGFSGAPLPLGVDGDGREVLTFVPGAVPWPHHFELLEPWVRLWREGHGEAWRRDSEFIEGRVALWEQALLG
jgi:hypothetical protein